MLFRSTRFSEGILQRARQVVVTLAGVTIRRDVVRALSVAFLTCVTTILGVVAFAGPSTASAAPDIAAPVVSAVSPNSGPETGGTAITITGTGFISGASVVIGQGNGASSGAVATDVVVVSSTEITAVTGAGMANFGGSEPWNLFVITSGGTSAANPGDDFTYVS